MNSGMMTYGSTRRMALGVDGRACARYADFGITDVAAGGVLRYRGAPDSEFGKPQRGRVAARRRRGGRACPPRAKDEAQSPLCSITLKGSFAERDRANAGPAPVCATGLVRLWSSPTR